MYPRITTLLAVTLLLSSKGEAWNWWWSSPPSEPASVETPTLSQPLHAGAITSTWITTPIPAGDSNWNTGSNWNNGVPNGIGDAAIFSPNPATVVGDIISNPPNQTFTLGSLLLDISASEGNILTLLYADFSLDFHASSGNASLQVLTNNGGQAVYGIVPGAGNTITLTSSLDITQNSAGDSTDDTALHIVGEIAGPGGINYLGSGKTILNNTIANTFTGPVNVSGGTLRLEYGGSIGINGDLSVSNTGTVSLESTNLFDSMVTDISMSGNSASLLFNGNNQSCRSLTLNGASLNTGIATLTITSGGVPIILTSSQLEGNITLTNGGTISVANNAGTNSFLASATIDTTSDPLTINVAKVNNFDLFTIATTFTNCPSITKTGLGTWTMTGGGVNSLPATTLSAGTLSIESQGSTAFTGNLTVNSGATLSMPVSVSISAPTLLNNGTVSLSSEQNSGNYHLTGNYTQGVGGNLLLNIANTHSAAIDKLIVSGTATLNGTLTVNLDTEDIVVDQDTVVIIEAASVTNTFSTISTNFPPGLSFDVGYTADTVFLTLHGNHIPSFNFLQSAGYMNFAEPLFAQNDAHNLQMLRRCAFLRNRLSPAKESQLIGLLASAQETPQQLSVSRFRNNPEGKPLSLYIAPLGSSGNFKRTHQQNAFNYRTLGGLMGADYAFTRAGIGAQIGYEHLHASVHHHWGSFNVNNLFGRFYGTFKPLTHVPFFIDANIGAGGEWYDIHRTTTQGMAQGKPQGWEWDAYLGLGYDGWMKGVRLTPLIAVQSMDIYLHKYSEYGAGTHNLLFPRQHMTSLRSNLGLSIGSKLVRRTVTWMPEVRGYWQHEFLGRSKNLTVATSLANITTQTTVMGLDKNYGILGTEQRFLWSDRWSLAADYDYQWSRHQRSNNFLIELGIYF